LRTLWILLLASGAAVADDAAMQRCRGISEGTARLACYDAITVPSPAPAPRAAAAASPASPAASPPQRQSPAQFGMEQRQVSQGELPSIQSHIPGHFEGWQPRTRIRLANGQVWQVTDDSTRRFDLDNPKVTIRRGALGSFFLDIEGDNHAPRVRRVE
jgi:hypothetical protein